MSDAIATLTAEHRVIARLLGSLELFADRMENAGPNERARVRDFASFFRDYVDTFHHGKEELLFVRLQDHGFPKDSGPVPALLSEHDEGREHLEALHQIGAGTGPMTREERQRAQGHALGYIMRLGPHIHREDVLLFPMIARDLPPEALKEIALEFERLDRTLAESGLLPRMQEAAARLQTAFPPDPSHLPSSYLPAGTDESI